MVWTLVTKTKKGRPYLSVCYFTKMETPLTPTFEFRKRTSNFFKFLGDCILFDKDDTGSVTKVKILQWPKLIALISSIIALTPFGITLFLVFKLCEIYNFEYVMEMSKNEKGSYTNDIHGQKFTYLGVTLIRTEFLESYNNSDFPD